ncbi:MAG: alpha-N-acetylglucosaminidase [Bacteroidales bacterium]|nr:alpha-N-acetylglucosaminidase [Bacteroidales bacterium]
MKATYNILSLLCAAALAVMAVSCTSSDPEVRAAKSLAGRIMPSKTAQISFVRTADTTQAFTLSSDRGRVVIAAPDANTMAVGLNYYLKNWCDVTVSWYAADRVCLPAELPLPQEPLRVQARVGERFFLNYCTFGYSLVWWQWKDWERLIDWMALNGVNRPLAITGQEAVWQKVWRELGMSDAQIRDYFTGPPFLPWQRMMNIDRWMGPLPQSWIDGQAKLQKKIVGRERELGMKPVLAAFSGHIPADMKELLPGADIRPVSLWDGFGEECRTYILHPDDPNFARIQKLFIEEQTRMFGTDHIYGLDIFNEVDFFESGPWDPDELARISHHVYDTLAASDPDAVWLQMGWMMYYDRAHWTPEIIRAYLGSVPQGKVIMLDYFLEKSMIWEYTDAFYGQPYYLCFLGNFGGNTLIEGDFDDIGPRIEKAFDDGRIAGLGCTLEGFGISPYLYEYVLDKAWAAPLSDEEWIERLADRRDGHGNPDVREAWRLLLHDAYVRPAVSSAGSRLCNRPSFDPGHPAPTWAYSACDPEILERAFSLLARSGCEGDAIRFDLVALGTKVMENRFDAYIDALRLAYAQKDAVAMEDILDEAEGFMEDLEAVLASDGRFSLQGWIDAARAMGKTAAEKDYYERCARTLLASWGGAGQLTDYAARQWSGLFFNYYKVRWDMFAEDALAALEAGEELDQQVFDAEVREFELAFGNSVEPLLTVPDADTYELCRRLAR